MVDRVTILGSTGSIGCSTLDVIRRNPDRFVVQALTAQTNLDLLFRQCLEFRPVDAVIGEATLARELESRCRGAGLRTRVLHGSDALVQVAADPAADSVMAAIVGAAGLLSSLAAAAAGGRLLLANKESLVMSGALFMDEVRAAGTRLLPIDSEHNAIFQCLPAPSGAADRGIERLVLTGSGGPLLHRPVADLARVTPEEACRHPNWKMGRKISVDSATMMNKGLEIIEACWLFDLGADRIEVLIHPQSVVHSMVRYRDGSVLAQLGQPDMRTPVAYGLAWPERIDSGVGHLDFAAMADLQFEPPDLQQFPCLRMAMDVARQHRTALPLVLNAANEVGVAEFLERRLPFPGIAGVIERTLERFDGARAADLAGILELDAEVRDFAARVCASAL